MLPKTEKLPVILAVEHVRSLHNIGSFFRVGAAAGIERIILSRLCGTPPRIEISKTALGGETVVPWEQPDNFSTKLQDLKKSGYTIYGLEQSSISHDLYTAEIQFPCVLIVGHEREGISQETLSLCDARLEIPMLQSGSHSLNVSTAMAVATYELGRRVWYDGNSQ